MVANLVNYTGILGKKTELRVLPSQTDELPIIAVVGYFQKMLFENHFRDF